MIKRACFFFIMFLLASNIAGSAFGYDAEKNHPDLTNAILDTYVRLSGTSVLPNGVSLDTKIQGEVVTSDGTLHSLKLTVRDWIIIGSAEEDWGGRKDAHYYDTVKSVAGRSFYSSGAPSWITDSAAQATKYVAAAGQTYASGDYTYQSFRSWFINSSGNYRAYKALGHLLHVLQDMGSPAHVRGLNDADVKSFESYLREHGSDMLNEIVTKYASSYDGYIGNNEVALGLRNIGRSHLPSYSKITDYFVGLAAYTRDNFYTSTTLHSSAYTKPGLPGSPPGTSFSIKDYVMADGSLVRGYEKGGAFILSRTMIKDKAGAWNNVVQLSPANHKVVYDKLVLQIVKYGTGFLFAATKSNTTPTVTVDVIAGRQSGNIPIGYKLYDSESDICSIIVTYSTDGGATFRAATTGPGGDGASGLAASPTGTSHIYYWNSEADVTTNEFNVILKIIPDDGQTGAGQATTAFDVFNNFLPPVADFVGVDKDYAFITVTYTLADVDYSVAAVQMFYSVDGGLTYNPATQGAGGDPVENLATAPAQTTYTYYWDSVTDLGNVDVANVYFKIIPSDAVSGNGAVEIGSPFPVMNSRPMVLIEQPVAELNGNAIFTYKLIDGTSTAHDITVEYSIDDGANYIPCTEGLGSDGLTALTSAPQTAGITHTFVWDSVTDIGISRYTNALLKVTIASPPGAGNFGVTTAFTISNTPRIQFTSPIAGAQTIGDVTVQYKLTAPSVVPGIGLTVEYSLDGGSTYTACNGYGDPIISQNATAAGTSLTYYWNTVKDLDNLISRYDNVKIRITEDVAGVKFESSEFKVYNIGLARDGWPKELGPGVGNRCRSPYYGPDYSGLPEAGAQRWVSPVSFRQYHNSPVVGPDGMIYAVGYTVADGYGLYAFYPEDGSKKWFLPDPVAANWTYTSPALAMDGTLYVCFTSSGGSGRLFAIDSRDGSLKWTSGRYIGNRDGWSGSPNIDPADGAIYLAGRNSSTADCYAVVDNGIGTAPTDKWGPFYYGNASYNPCGMPAVDPDNDVVMFTPTFIYRHVAALRRSNGGLIWEFNTSSNVYYVYGALMVHEGYAYVGRENAGVYKAKTSSYSVPWARDLGDYHRSFPAAVGYNGVLYMHCNSNNNLYAYTTDNVQNWVFPLLGANSYPAPVVDKAGIIYQMGGQYLQAIRDLGASAENKWYADTGANGNMSDSIISLALGSDANIYVAGRANQADSYLRCYGKNTPAVQSATPSVVINTKPMVIKIYGGGFTTTAGGAGPATEVKLKKGVDEQILATFTVVNYTTIYAEVPAGLAIGDWDIIVTSPNGANTTSFGKLTITN